MGLDMFLTGKRHLYGFRDGEEKVLAESIQRLFPELANMKNHWGDHSPVKAVHIDAGYWRKANAIHNWFVQNVQHGEDECRPHEVTRDQLIKLRSICKQVLDNPALAGELLPVKQGFFFGSTEYDEWYFDDLKLTIEIVDNCMALPQGWYFEYCSSW